MSKIHVMEKQKFILAKLFSLHNKLQAIGDRLFDGEITLRQWLLTMAVAQYGDTSPSLSNVAEFMGCSHQNIKELALKLEKKGFLNIVKDENNLRATCLVLTEKSFTFWKSRQEEIRQYIIGLFKDLSKDEIDLLHDFIDKLYERVLTMERVVSKKRRCCVFKVN